MKRKVLMASLDVKRPAAQEQLAVLGRQVGVETLPVVAGQTPVQIARRAEQAARLQGLTSCFSTPPAAPISTRR